MKKNVVFLVVTFVFTTIVSCSDRLEEIEHVSELHKNPLVENGQMKAMLAYEELMKSFNRGSTRSKSIDYPSYYGGCYINEDNKLVVYITENMPQTKSFMTKDLVDNNDVILASCEYSYNELIKIMDRVDEFMLNDSTSSLFKNISAVSLMDKQNQVVVKLKEFNDNRISEFEQQIMKSPAIKFQKAEKTILPYANIQPGIDIKVWSWFTLGYRVKLFTGEEGYITAGHGIAEGEGFRLSENGPVAAYCVQRSLGGNSDAAYCRSTYYASYSDMVKNTNMRIIGSSSPIAGQRIVKSGRGSGVTAGYVISSSTSITLDSRYYFDIAAADYYSIHGDSGAPVVSDSGSNTYILGIVQGGDGTTSYFSKSENINSLFRCEVY